MATKRDTWNYDLKVGNQIVYRGTTNDPERRAAEHANEGKYFTGMEIKGRAKSQESARSSEAEDLARYRRGHGGQNPIYNKKDDG